MNNLELLDSQMNTTAGNIKASKPTIEDLVAKLKVLDMTVLRARLERGYVLRYIKEGAHYINYDSYVSNWNEFLECISLDRETARQDIMIYTRFYKYLDRSAELMVKCKYERLVRLLPLVKEETTDDKVIELLEMSAISSVRDFKNTVKEEKGLVPDDKCVDVKGCNNPKQLYEKCVTCGAFIRREDLE